MAKKASLGSTADLGNISGREAVKAERGTTKRGWGPPAHGNKKSTYKGVIIDTVHITPKYVY